MNHLQQFLNDKLSQLDKPAPSTFIELVRALRNHYGVSLIEAKYICDYLDTNLKREM